jgi:hypothetical protein
MSYRAPSERDFRIFSQAIQLWYRFYEADPDEHVTQTLFGAWSIKVNAPYTETLQ